MSALSDTTCLVIGGRGFVGSAIAAGARQAGWHVEVVGREDYRSRVGARFQVVINASGNPQRFKANREPLWDFDQSVQAVYRSLFDFDFAHYALISSVDVYNDTRTAGATSEEVAIDAVRLAPYGFHKRLAELCVARQAASWQIFRLGQMIGPGLRKGPVFDLLRGQLLRVSSASRFPFLHTRTVGRAVIELIARAPRNGVYNVCGRGSVDFGRVAELCGKAVVADDEADRERQEYEVNSDKAHRIFPLPASWDELRGFVEAERGGCA